MKVGGWMKIDLDMPDWCICSRFISAACLFLDLLRRSLFSMCVSLLRVGLDRASHMHMSKLSDCSKNPKKR